MNQFYSVTTALKEYLMSHQNINRVVLGNLNEVDMDKQTIYPLAQIIVEDTTFEDASIRFNVKVLAMDIVKYSNELVHNQHNVYLGNNNKQDVYNDMLSVVNGLQTNLKRGKLYHTSYQLDGFPTAQPFEDEHGNLLTGWMLDFTILVPNVEVSTCVEYLINLITYDNSEITYDNSEITF